MSAHENAGPSPGSTSSAACGWCRRTSTSSCSRVLAGLWMAAAGGALSSASVNFGGDKVLINGPYALAFGIAFLGFAGVTVIGSVAGRAVQQDYEYGTYHFFFSAPIRKADYFFGRLIGAWLTLVLIFLSIALGIVIGCNWPGVDCARIVAHPSCAELRAAVPVPADPEHAVAVGMLLRARRAHAPDGAGVRRGRHPARRLPVRDQSPGRHGEQDARGAWSTRRAPPRSTCSRATGASRRRTRRRSRFAASSCGTALLWLGRRASWSRSRATPRFACRRSTSLRVSKRKTGRRVVRPSRCAARSRCPAAMLDRGARRVRAHDPGPHAALPRRRSCAARASSRSCSAAC